MDYIGAGGEATVKREMMESRGKKGTMRRWQRTPILHVNITVFQSQSVHAEQTFVGRTNRRTVGRSNKLYSYSYRYARLIACLGQQ